MPNKLNLVDSLLKDPKFSILAKAVSAADLTEVLKNSGPFTVLAPTDDAFSKLSPATWTDLMKPESKGKLAEIVKYHVISGKVTSDAISKLTSAKTLQGSEIRVDAANGIKLNEAKMEARNIEASNGVIHVIDTVLAPAVAAKA